MRRWREAGKGRRETQELPPLLLPSRDCSAGKKIPPWLLHELQEMQGKESIARYIGGCSAHPISAVHGSHTYMLEPGPQCRHIGDIILCGRRPSLLVARPGHTCPSDFYPKILSAHQPDMEVRAVPEPALGGLLISTLILSSPGSCSEPLAAAL